MNTRLIIAIFRKEILETLRDRRTLFIMLIVPVILYPMLLIGVGQVVTHQVSQLTEQTSKVAVLGTLPEGIEQHLGATEVGDDAIAIEFDESIVSPFLPKKLHFEADSDDPRGLRFMDPAITEWAFERLKANEVDAILLFQPGAAEAYATERSANTAVLFDATRESSQQASDRINLMLFRAQRSTLDARLAAHPELPPGFNRPFKVAWENLAPPTRQGNYMVGRILPTLMMMMILIGAFYPAVDLTAGEKERGTMQTLLTSPARPMDIIFGKFLTVFTVAMVAAMANLLSMAAAFTLLFQDMGISDQAAFQIEWQDVAMLIIQLVPVGCFVSAVMLGICVIARSYKEAQHYLTPIYILLLVPIILSALPGVKLVTTTAWMPVLNIMLLIRTSLLDPVGIDAAGMVLVANITWAALALILAMRIFENEEVLLGSDGAAKDAFRIKPETSGTATPTLTLAIVTFCLGMVLLVYAGSGLQKMHLIGGMLATQWGLMAIPCILVARGLHFSVADTFSFRKPSIRAIIGAILIGMGGWVAIGGMVAWGQNFVLPVPESFAKQMHALLGIEDNRYPLWLMLATFALTPAICEELFFRGLFIAGLRAKLTKWTAITVCGTAFGLFHLSIYRVLPTAVLGFVIAWVLWETRSIIPCILLHFFNNATALCVAKGVFPDFIPNPTRSGEMELLLVLPWAILCVVGFFIIRSSTPGITVQESQTDAPEEHA